MSRILLTTLNARYSHSAFGLRYIFAQMRHLQAITQIREYTISQNPRTIAESILSERPQVVGFGVYIWNTRQTLEIVSILKRVRPDLKIILGGPEVSYETESQEICRLADLTIQGEGDFEFYNVCSQFLESGHWPSTRHIAAALPEISQLESPYPHYSEEDVRNRVIYVEASRGCPYKCEYCLSSLDKSVRSFDVARFLAEMDQLIARGVRQFKFIDRTFNLKSATSTRILEFFLERISLGVFLHFEMVPDRLPEELRTLIRKFPKGALQFEIGVQTWNPEVAALVSRRQDYAKICENFEFLAEVGNVHTHADLIAGLPGETLESFARGFNALYELRPDEIQVGILKRLRGLPIIRHDSEWEMIYQAEAPYTVLQTKTMSFNVIQGITRFSNYWDQVANSGNFIETMQLLKQAATTRETPSLYHEFEELTEWLNQRHPQGHSISLLGLLESVWEYLRSRPGFDPDTVRDVLVRDYTRTTKRDIPRFLRSEGLSKTAAPQNRAQDVSAVPSRQKRHISAQESLVQ